eukprot:940326-Prorocentrum_minimum.AAC.2
MQSLRNATCAVARGLRCSALARTAMNEAPAQPEGAALYYRIRENPTASVHALSYETLGLLVKAFHENAQRSFLRTSESTCDNHVTSCTLRLRSPS